MLTYTKDKNGQDILLDNNGIQIMMEWEMPLMQAHIDELKPKGNVLEIGFGLGYSATQILKYDIENYTIIECDPTVIKKAKEWAKDYNNINIIEAMWQDIFEDLNVYDTIFFDPTSAPEKPGLPYKLVENNWHLIFIELAINHLMRKGSRLSLFLPETAAERYREFIKKQHRISYYEQEFRTNISDECRYKRQDDELIIPIIEKIV